jgi:CelD/BcsL family acetyltransferase involved in cellulose biosynthesis
LIYTLNPMKDPRWTRFIAGHPQATVFHSVPWLTALHKTYGYDPIVVTTAPPNAAIEQGIVFCRVSSWVTGTRLVSLPFADHCEPLVNDANAGSEISEWLQRERAKRHWKYVELRPLAGSPYLGDGLRPGDSYCFHELDLSPGLDELHHALHKDSIQRKIRRAEREGLSYESGSTPRLLEEFYHLLLITRRRLHALPQPRGWFRNLSAALGADFEIRVARKNGSALASILSLRHRSSVVYKYGASDHALHNLGGMPFLFWKLIGESKAAGAERIDFGRSDLDNPGLITFKNRFGTSKKSLTYLRATSAPEETAWNVRALRPYFYLLPDALCSTAGRVLYRHMG